MSKVQEFAHKAGWDTLDADSYRQKAKRAFDFLTLGKFKWWFLLGYFLCFVIPKIVIEVGIPNQFLLPRETLGFYPHSIHYWIHSGFLPLRFPDTLLQWSYKWVELDLFQQIGIPLNALLVLLFLIACLRGE